MWCTAGQAPSLNCRVFGQRRYIKHVLRLAGFQVSDRTNDLYSLDVRIQDTQCIDAVTRSRTLES